jgi:hypothetical protein
MDKKPPPEEKGDDRTESRAKSLETDQLEVVADPEAQAARMLEESDKRTEDATDRDEDDDTIERRTSKEASGLGKGAETSTEGE